MQRIHDTLRLSTPAQAHRTEEHRPALIRNGARATASPRADRVSTMRERAVLATLDNERPDLLQQLHSHLGSRTLARTLSNIDAARQVKALQLLPTGARAAVYRELSTAQRALWHQACRAEAQRHAPWLNRLAGQLRAGWQRLFGLDGKSAA